ncbi:MAG: oxygenase MpaB family protein [Acidimicrobiales bacterium]
MIRLDRTVDRVVGEPVKRAVAGSVLRMLGSRRTPPDDDWLLGDAGDPGLFGPDSVAWKVHADLTSMLTGGISALLLQTLHPGAMAGVADHSDYRRDPTGRLHRTGAFIVNTTYGSTREAERAIDAVRRIHDRVNGVRPDGIPYDANDPELLTWVHVAEVGQFLRSYQRYGPGRLSARDVDRYYAEVAEVARRLGARRVPTSAAEVRDYYRRVRPALTGTEQAIEAVGFLTEPKGATLSERSIYGLLVQAAIAVLPHWARPMLGLPQPIVVGEAFRLPTWTAGTVLRWALGESPVVARARQRTELAGVVHARHASHRSR